MVKVKVAGKLYWGGEYAVIEPGYSAVIMPVKRYLTAEAFFCQGRGKISSDLFSYGIDFDYIQNTLQIAEDSNYSLIIQAVKLVSCYLNEKKIRLRPFEIRISSQLHQEEQKYGFGSSGAVVVAVVRAMLQLYEMENTNQTVFRLACLILLQSGSNSSMGDVACAAFGKLIIYTSFDRKQIADLLGKEEIHSILERDWWPLSIREIHSRLDMEPMIGWTRKTAVSQDLVQKVLLVKEKVEYQSFLRQSETAVKEMVSSLENADKNGFCQAICHLRKYLLDLSGISKVELETKELRELVEIAQKYDAVAKLSGAGGGDCGIIFLFDKGQKDFIIHEMQAKRIEYLPFA